MSAAWSARAASLALVALSLAAVPAADAATLRLDGRFGEGGIAWVRFRSTEDMGVLRPVRQPDGKVLVPGANHFFHGNAQIMLARFTRTGRPDAAFGHNGRERLGLRWNFAPRAVHVQPDGRILVLGEAGYAPFMYPTPGQFGLVRLLPDGSRDRTFGTNGFVAWNPPWRANAVALYAFPGVFVPQADGRLLAAGVATELVRPPGGLGSVERQRVVFVRFNQDGSVDESFGSAGLIEGPGSTDVFWRAWAALPDGHIVALSSRNEGSGVISWWFHRFTAGGVVDRDFGSDGSVRLGSNVLYDVHELLPMRDGSLVMLGTVDPNHPAGSMAAVRRITPGGQLDPSFGTACGGPGPRGGGIGGTATSDGGILATVRGFVRHSRIDSLVLRYGTDGCVAGRPLRIKGLTAAPPTLQGRHRALIGATDHGGLALIRIRR